MSKKSRVAYKSVQRRKPKTQKHIELVTDVVSASRKEETQAQDQSLVTRATVHSNQNSPAVVEHGSRENEVAYRKSSASAHLASRKAAPLMTATELGYVKRDLITIAGLSGVMLTILFVCYLILGA
ncbi:MAG TPA: hypothetical protein DHW02_16495 [Ktedonobacter sp.]|nr:hypothetical protein [Ktedonobacter sp.]